MRAFRSLLIGVVSLALLIAQSGGVIAQESDEAVDEPESIVLIGNSLTFWNEGVEAELAALIASQDPPGGTKVDHFTLGGYTLKDHYRDSKSEARFGALDAIRSGKHDVVVLQDDIPEYKDQDLGQFMEYARLFGEEIDSAGARPVFFMAWPYARLGWVSLDDIVALHRAAEDELGATVAPVALAMALARAQRPDIPMLDLDAEHPSVPGTYLTAATIYATIFDRSPEGLYYPDADLNEDDAAFLQLIAWEAVQAWNEGESVVPMTEDAGAAAQGDTDAPVWVKLLTQTNCRMEADPGTYEQGAELAKKIRDLPLACDSTYSDARLSGTGHTLYNEDCFESGICVGWGTLEIDGSDGSWSGWWHEIDDDETDGEDNTSFHIVLTGSGGYEGLTAILYSLGVWGEFPDEYGVIYRGDPPPGPEELLTAQ